ncbi:MAG: AI-2E family transporter [Nitriliruptoraceae bacterium]
MAEHDPPDGPTETPTSAGRQPEEPDTARPRRRTPVIRRGRDERVPEWLDTSTQYAWRGLLLVIALTVALYVLTRLYLVTLPIIIAMILATLCVPPARKLERRGVPRLLAATIVVLGGIGSLIGLIALMTPAFVSQVQQLAPTVAEGVETTLDWLEEGPIGYDRSQLEDLFSQGMEALEGSAGDIAQRVGTIAVAIGQGLTALVLALVLLFFFVKDGSQLVGWCIDRTPPSYRNHVRAVGARAWVALSGFVRGTALVALVDAVGIGVGLAIVGVPLVLPLSALVFLGAFIPVIGATVTGVLAVLVALASDGLVAALIVTAIVLIVQQIESNVLQPTIMRRAVALHPVVILAVLTAGAVLIGIVGAFLAVPVTAVVAAVGNELRLRSEVAKQGGSAGPSPIGGPGVDPETVTALFPEDTRLRSARYHRRSRTRELVRSDGTIEVVAREHPDPDRFDTDEFDDLGDLRTSELKDLRRRTEQVQPSSEEDRHEAAPDVEHGPATGDADPRDSDAEPEHDTSPDDVER